MTFKEYQETAVRTAVYGEGNQILYPALGLGNEAGEVLGKIKKVLRDNDGMFDKEHVKKISDEMGDVLWYLAALARDLGIDFNDIARDNLTKLARRQAEGTIKGDGDSR